MFTGIIEDLGEIAAVDALDEGVRLTVRTSLPTAELTLGESIAINGACMTVVETTAEGFAVDVSAESLRRTTLETLVAGDRVNLERSLRLGDRLGGHVVTGHVDGTGEVLSVRCEGESAIHTFGLEPALAAALVEKGSIAVDGVSLTCFACGDRSFDVAIIPHTATHTTIGRRSVGDAVNLENDLIGKYVAKLVAKGS